MPSRRPGAHANERFRRQAAKLIRFSDTANAAFLGVPAKTMKRWYYDHADRQARYPPGNLTPITSLGIDELSFKQSTASSSR